VNTSSRHGLGEAEDILAQQLKLGKTWRIASSGFEPLSRPLTRDAVEGDEVEVIAFCEIKSAKKMERELERAKCPVCAGSMRRFGTRATRSWLHLPIFGKRTEIRAELPRLRCNNRLCDKTVSVNPPWESSSKHFSLSVEEALIREVAGGGLSHASRMLGIPESTLHKLLNRRIDRLVEEADWRAVTAIGVDDYAIDKGQSYISIFSDIARRRVLFVVRGRTHAAVKAFLAEGEKRGLVKDKVAYVSMDMGKGYIKGMNESFPLARKIFDKFHVIKLANDKVDQIRRAECTKAELSVRATLNGKRWIFLKNQENLTEKELNAFKNIDMSTFWTGRAYQVRCALQQVYAFGDAPTALHRLRCLIKWIRRLCKKAPSYFSRPMNTLANTLEEHAQGIVAHWDNKLTNAFHEGLHSVFSAIKRRSRGLGFTGMRAHLFLHFGRLPFGFDLKQPFQVAPMPTWTPRPQSPPSNQTHTPENQEPKAVS